MSGESTLRFFVLSSMKLKAFMRGFLRLLHWTLVISAVVFLLSFFVALVSVIFLYSVIIFWLLGGGLEGFFIFAEPDVLFTFRDAIRSLTPLLWTLWVWMLLPMVGLCLVMLHTFVWHRLRVWPLLLAGFFGWIGASAVLVSQVPLQYQSYYKTINLINIEGYQHLDNLAPVHQQFYLNVLGGAFAVQGYLEGVKNYFESPIEAASNFGVEEEPSDDLVSDFEFFLYRKANRAVIGSGILENVTFDTAQESCEENMVIDEVDFGLLCRWNSRVFFSNLDEL